MIEMSGFVRAIASPVRGTIVELSSGSSLARFSVALFENCVRVGFSEHSENYGFYANIVGGLKPSALVAERLESVRIQWGGNERIGSSTIGCLGRFGKRDLHSIFGR